MSPNDSAPRTITPEEIAAMNADEFLTTIATIKCDTMADTYILLFDQSSTTYQISEVRALSRLTDIHGGFVTRKTLLTATSVDHMAHNMHSKASTVMWVRKVKAGLIDDDSVFEARPNSKDLAAIMQQTEIGNEAVATMLKTSIALSSEGYTKTCFDAALKMAKDCVPVEGGTESENEDAAENHEAAK